MLKEPEVHTDPIGRKYYLDPRMTFSRLELSEWCYKEIHPQMVNTLLADMKERWVLEPITCYIDNDGKVKLANGKHRMAAAKKHDAIQDKAEGRIQPGWDRWMLRPVDAKVFVDLDLSQVPELVMALDDVRKKAVAGEKQVGLVYSYTASRDKLRKSGMTPSEEEILRQMQYIQIRMRKKRGKLFIPWTAAREVIVARHIYKLFREDESAKIRAFLTTRQVPRRKIVAQIMIGKYPLMTTSNLASALKHFVRSEPISTSEMQNGNDPRELEYENIRSILNVFVEEVLDYFVSNNVDNAVAIVRRFQIEAIGLFLKDLISVEAGLPILTIAPIKISEVFRKRVRLLREVEWTDPIMTALRSAREIYNGSLGYPGLMPLLIKKV